MRNYTPDEPLGKVLARLENVRGSGDKYTARCPAHDDRSNSLSVTREPSGKVLLNCFVGCQIETVVGKIGLQMRDLFPSKPSGAVRERSVRIQTKQARTNQSTNANQGEIPATVQQSDLPGCTLAEYAENKSLPVELLRGLGLCDGKYSKVPAIRIPYYLPDGREVTTRFRTALQKGTDDNRFRWPKGAKLTLYGLWRLETAREAGELIFNEGESDTQTAWFHGLPAIGIPGAANWQETWIEFFEGIERIYFIIEPDMGGSALLKWLAKSVLRFRAYLVRLDGFKDLSEMHLDDPDKFMDRWDQARKQAISWQDWDRHRVEEEAEGAWSECKDLARSVSILDEFGCDIRECGVAGEERLTKIIYLTVMTRFLDRLASLAIKGPSSSGKSFITEQTLSFFPSSAYYPLTAMSDHFLAYTNEPLNHRFLVIYEAQGFASETASYLTRSILSEGRVDYAYVAKGPQGLHAKHIEIVGPTGLITTTTAVSLHPENETRLLSLTVTDSAEQTAAILRRQAERDCGVEANEIDLGRWHSLQVWISGQDNRVVVPFAKALAAAIPPVATRLRRNVRGLVALTKAHAILHQATRMRDSQGRICATFADYHAVRELIVDIISAGVGSTVSSVVRATVEAAHGFCENGETASVSELAKAMKIDKGSASRRVKQAVSTGFLVNNETLKGKPSRLTIGDPLPEDVVLLPTVESLMDSCAVADENEEYDVDEAPQLVESTKHVDRAEANRVPFIQEIPGAFS